MGDEKWEMGDGRWEMGDGEWEMGDGRWEMGEKHRAVILGGGFGGLAAAQKLKRASVEITLIDRRNFHLFQPLLYQVATRSLSPGAIAPPFRRVLSKPKNVQVLMGAAGDVDP